MKRSLQHADRDTTTSRQEAEATVTAAADWGITFLDVAPSYGDEEAEKVIGETFGSLARMKLGGPFLPA